MEEAVAEAMRQIGEMRAGLRPMPGPNEPVHPVVRMFVATMREAQAFEADLAQELGPDDAHRVTFSEDICMSQSTFGGPWPPHAVSMA